tara:strand:- start:16460 stop:17089 length:630 start_codon:yes stop_codon:yes gene_type:complete
VVISKWTRNSIQKEFSVSRETMRKLEVYVMELVKWQSKTNLIGNSTLDKIWERHIVDSLQLIKYFPSNFKSLIDFGTGAGLPGFVLAIYFEQKSKDIYLIDSNQKKCAFLNAVAAKCDVKANIVSQRIEDINPGELPSIDIVTARAFSSVSTILKLAQPLVAKGSKFFIHKGNNIKSEFDEFPISSHLNMVYHKSILDEKSVILDISYE